MVFVTNKPIELILQGVPKQTCTLDAVDINAFLNMQFPKSLVLDLLPGSGRIASTIQRKCSNTMTADIEFNSKNEIYVINHAATHVVKIELL